MSDKKSGKEDHTEIAFNWERVKKKAQTKIDELKCNAPKISRREEMEILQKRSARMVECFEKPKSGSKEPFSHIPTLDPDGKPVNTSLQESSNPNQNRAATTLPKTDPNTEPYIDNPVQLPIDRDGTPNTQLLARPSAQGSEETLARGEETSLVRRSETTMDLDIGDNLGPDRNAVELLRLITEGNLDGRDMEKDERQLVVSALRTNGQTQDAIAQLLKVSRRTIVSDCKYLRQMAALEVTTLETTDLAGEVYTTAKAAIDRALKAGKLKTVSTLLRDMVELLQSMGIVYRAPKTSMQANLNANMGGSRKGYQKYIEAIGNDKAKVVDVLDCVFEHIAKGSTCDLDL